MMKIFYEKRCIWIVDAYKFDSYDSAFFFCEGMNKNVKNGEDMFVVVQKECVKIFAYEYNALTSEIKIAQTVWRYEGPAQEHSYWTHRMRKSHLLTLKARFNSTDKSVSTLIDNETWENSLVTGREKLVKQRFYRQFMK